MGSLKKANRSISSLILGSRGSALALAQTRSVANLLLRRNPCLQLEEKIITTQGDKDQTLAIHQPTAEASGLFTRQLEDELMGGNIDMAVHSLKDLPVVIPQGLELAAILPRASSNDLLITREPADLTTLSLGAIIGTSSPRRLEILRSERPDFHFVPIRGNVPTRLSKLSLKQHSPQLDAIVLAQAGLERLGYDFKDQTEGEFSFEKKTFFWKQLSQMLPAPGQGAIAIETTTTNDAALRYAKSLHDEKTAICVTTERLLLQYLGGGCHMALGALATFDQPGERIFLRGVYFPYANASPRLGEAYGATPEETALLVAIKLGEKLAHH